MKNPQQFRVREREMRYKIIGFKNGTLQCWALCSMFYFGIASPSTAQDDIWQILQSDRLEKLSSDGRFIFWAEYFIDQPYHGGGPLGEGKNGRWDTDPLYRFDAFDCTTYLETVLALAHSSSKPQFEQTMNTIRYANGNPDFLERNHIVTTAWVPNVIDHGYVRSHEDHWSYAVQTTQTQFNYGAWLEFTLLNRLNAPVNDVSDLKLIETYPAKRVASSYLSISLLLQHWTTFKNEISRPHVLNVVRPDWPLQSKIGTDLLVSHQGIVIKDESDETLRFLHASTQGKVVNVALKDYLQSYGPSHSVQGIQLFEIQ